MPTSLAAEIRGIGGGGDLNGMRAPDYNNLIRTSTSSGQTSFYEDCYVYGTVKSPSSENSYLEYYPVSTGGTKIEMYNTVNPNTVISVSFFAYDGDHCYIRGGATVNLKIFGLR